MVKAELIKQSPLRIFDDSNHGGLGKGNIGVLVASHGVGKTAALVHLATDKLLQEKPVIHVTFGAKMKRILDYYEEIFSEISKLKSLENASEIHDEIVRHRTVMSFDQKSFSTAHILKSLSARISSGSTPTEAVILDEFDFTRTTPEDIREYLDFARREKIELWFSMALEDDEGFSGSHIPQALEKCIDNIAVLVSLSPVKGDSKVQLRFIKNHDHKPLDSHLVLDSRTLLIVRD